MNENLRSWISAISLTIPDISKRFRPKKDGKSGEKITERARYRERSVREVPIFRYVRVCTIKNLMRDSNDSLPRRSLVVRGKCPMMREFYFKHLQKYVIIFIYSFAIINILPDQGCESELYLKIAHHSELKLFVGFLIPVFKNLLKYTKFYFN